MDLTNQIELSFIICIFYLPMQAYDTFIYKKYNLIHTIFIT